MKRLILLLLFSVSLTSAQQIQLTKDSIASTKDTLVIQVKNNMLSPIYFKLKPKTESAKKIRYVESMIIPADTIYAAREGIVVMTKSDSKKCGRTRKFINDANYVIIQHDDGTTASYYHLQFEGVLIEKGVKVERGAAIGISGMTGFTTTPHLHFVVRKSTEKDGNISIPILFEGYENIRFKKGKKYARKS